MPIGYPISAKVIEDSLSPSGIRLTTLELEFPRYILAEFGTHRVFSRNTSSSRAIPTKKLIDSAMEKFVEPVRYGINKSGMQPSLDNLEGEALAEARQIWMDMAEYVVKGCRRLAEIGLHKQWASRPLEWFTTVRLVASATDFRGFFNLRDHFEAQDEIHYLTHEMINAMNNSTPILRAANEWHLPYVTEEERGILSIDDAVKVSASRCARTSYKTQHGVTSTLEEDIALFNRLRHDDSKPFDIHEDIFHASPTEHPCIPAEIEPYMPSNMRGWNQLRKFIENNMQIPGKA